jgi:outer membrane protein OmpA-like peptidoglycan-associated protein
MRIFTSVLSIASIVLLSSCAVFESMKCSCCRNTASTTNETITRSIAQTSTVSGSTAATAKIADKSASVSAASEPAVYFDTKKTQLPVSAKSELAKVTAFLKNNPSATVKASAFSDGVGRAELNQQLGELRISSVKQFLQSQGVDSARIQTENRAAEGGAERKVLIQVTN